VLFAAALAVRAARGHPPDLAPAPVERAARMEAAEPTD
jgi:hypothetical protein